MREMKDSGVEWIGEIPKNWKICRLKDYAHICNGRDYSEVLDEAGDYPVIGSGGQFAKACEPLYQKESVLLGRKGTIDKPLFVDYPFWTVDTMYYTEIKENASAKYFYYLCTQIEFDFYQYGSAVPSMTQRDLYNVNFPYPTLDEQRRIADYLDRKCSQIDAIIARQQEVIEKLKAYKLSVITEAVTKGVNPDVPMKDSGVEWIGKIPEHWKVVRLKFLLSHIIDCPHETPIYSADGDYLVIRTADQDLGKLRTDEDMYRLDEGEYQNRIRRMPLEKDDIVYGREGERWGLACLVPESNKYCLGQRMLQFRCKRELFLPRFAMWALNSKFVYLQGAVDTIGSTSPHVNISTVRNFLIPVLPISEQQEIAEYIDKKMSQLDKEIEHRENLICKLNEYKKSLIYEVVTGKQEV